MSVISFWDIEEKEPNLKKSDWDFQKSQTSSRKSLSPAQSRVGDAILNNYLELIDSKSNLSTSAKQAEPLERPFDFYDDDEFQFGVNLLNNNVACVGENMSKLVQMAQEPWPDDVKLFQPYEVEQILLPDNASCLAVQAFLKMCNLAFEVEMRWNAEFMSPSGRVPFIKCGAFVVSELEPIVQFAGNKGVSLCARLSTEEKAEMRAYMSLITNVLVNAELYISWIDNETFNTVTKVRNSSVYPWPLGWLQTRAKRNTVAKRLKALHWHDKTLDQVLADVEQCCNSLSQRLGDKEYFFGTPTPLDALVYGHVRALLCARGPRAGVIIKPVTGALLRHVMRMTQLIGMPLTPQEDYLLNQAFTISRRRFSPERSNSDRCTRIPRSRMSLRNQSKENIVSKDIFGFKPFASKKIIIMTSREGNITCQYSLPHKFGSTPMNPGDYNFAVDIIEDVLDKVDEMIVDEFTEKHDGDTEKNGFEVIAFPSNLNDEGNKSDSFGPNEEQALETNLSVEDGLEDVIQIINDEETTYSEGLIGDKHLTEAMFQENEFALVTVEEPPIVLTAKFSSESRSSRKSALNEELKDNLDVTECSDVTTDTNKTHETKSSSIISDLRTQIMPDDGEINVESLLNYLRKKNAAYDVLSEADID